MTFTTSSSPALLPSHSRISLFSRVSILTRNPWRACWFWLTANVGMLSADFSPCVTARVRLGVKRIFGDPGAALGGGVLLLLFRSSDREGEWQGEEREGEVGVACEETEAR